MVNVLSVCKPSCMEPHLRLVYVLQVSISENNIRECGSTLHVTQSLQR